MLRRVMIAIFVLLSLVTFSNILELNLSRYPLVSFYVSAESTPTRIIEDGKNVEFWFGKAKEGFVSDLDIVMVLDTSGSMRKVMGFLDDLMAATLDKLNSSGIRVRTGMVTFTDELLKIYPLTTNASNCIAWLQDAIPFGGGDDNELSLDALLEAANFDFDPHARKVILLITNAPPHQQNDGTEYSSLTLQDVQKELSERDFNLIIIGPPIDEFKSFVERARAQFFNINAIWEVEEAFNSALATFFKSYLLEYRTPNFDFEREHIIEVELEDGSKVYTSYLSPEKTNSPPIINSLSVIPPVSFPGEPVRINVQAKDMDGDTLAFRWKLNGQLLEEDQEEITITPEATGTFNVSCEVRDGRTSSIAHTGFRVIEKQKPEIVKTVVEKVIKPEQDRAALDITTIEKQLGITFSSYFTTDINADSSLEIIAGTDSEGLGTLYMFDSKGQPIWHITLSDDSVFWPDDSFRIDSILCGDVNDDGKKEIVALLNHMPWFPSIIAVVSSDGSILGKYFHPGHIQLLKLEDIEGDGIDDIVFAGENAEYNFSVVFGILDGRKPSGQAKPYFGLGVPPAREKFYRLLPEAIGIGSISIIDGKVLFIDETGQEFEISK
ncbi:hypothetical protein AT15_07380 [Kosmotoga arenicorallina S304]|uniref:VWFA domain-containing protein n=1 Tax=Kosmotoga arenicorallina S304 TaxID=1453497 RepID=A0A182C7N2_9BACT|nr:VWA domain-containing protein [Kosmotoga arenicorallina]OAA31310.1 hypothetical protein AT15_07380 [Kosmotoga arenicorallina S304]